MVEETSLTDEQKLLQRAARYDRKALGQIYDEYSPGIYRYALRLLGDQATAEDCVSETFSRLLYAFHQGKGPSRHLKAYLYRIAHNWITDQYRRQPLPSVQLEEDLNGGEVDEPVGMLSRQEERQQVRCALAGLTQEQRQVVVLKFLEDWTNEEIALALHKSTGAVKALQHRALESLKKIIVKTGVL
jgi:RNA polymerase sigma-70 factor, ECF subfamily